MRPLGLLLVLSTALGLAGCTYVLNPLEVLMPAPPPALAVKATISNLVVVPAEIKAGGAASLNFTFDYEDLNADVGPDVAQVEIQSRAVSGNFNVNTAAVQASAVVRQDATRFGRKGRVTLTRTINVPASASGVLGFSLVLIDAAQQRSNALSAQVSVSPSSQGGGVGPGGQRCTILDGNHQPVTSVRIGRQVFFRMVDPDNNFSSDTQDRLFRVASFQGGASGDVEVIFWMLETGTNTGVFEGPPGGLLLTSRFPVINNGELSVLDNDTVVATYEDPNGPGDVCIALAKVR